MTTYDAFLLPDEVALFMAAIGTTTLSGTVTKDSIGVERDILIYKNYATDLMAETISDSNGDFSITVDGGGNDLFRVIAVGKDGENSEIFEDVEG